MVNISQQLEEASFEIESALSEILKDGESVSVKYDFVFDLFEVVVSCNLYGARRAINFNDIEHIDKIVLWFEEELNKHRI